MPIAALGWNVFASVHIATCNLTQNGPFGQYRLVALHRLRDCKKMLSTLGEDLEGGNHSLDHSNLSSNAWDN